MVFLAHKIAAIARFLHLKKLFSLQILENSLANQPQAVLSYDFRADFLRFHLMTILLLF